MQSTPRSAKARNLGSIRALPPPFLPSNGAGNSRDLIFTRRASDDLREIGDWTAQHFGHAAASDYLSRLEQACGKLLIDPLRAPAYPYARAISGLSLRTRDLSRVTLSQSSRVLPDRR
ncbi:MAG: type II toxin-antitoxin system RelE/ParE family toxin [Sphingomicrobium sp.]